MEKRQFTKVPLAGLPLRRAVVVRDLARIAGYNDKPLPARAFSGTAINEDVTYVAQVSICSETFDLIVDAGSSNIWVRIVGQRRLIPCHKLVRPYRSRPLAPPPCSGTRRR